MISLLSRLFAAADGTAGKRFDEAFRVRVVAAAAAASGKTAEEGRQ